MTFIFKSFNKFSSSSDIGRELFLNMLLMWCEACMYSLSLLIKASQESFIVFCLQKQILRDEDNPE
jgi:hypothetical protein